MSKRLQSAEDRREAQRIAKWARVVGRADRELAVLRTMATDGLVNARSWAIVHRQLLRVTKALEPMSKALVSMSEKAELSHEYAVDMAKICGVPLDEE